MPDVTVLVRDALASDRDSIIEFNALLARETESKGLDAKVLERGVEAALADPDRLRYWVAEVDGRLVGQAAVTREWSDWRCGWVWWFQSVYVAATHRGRGVFRAIHARIREEARNSVDVIGLRLYVEQQNHAARRTYQSLGMTPGGYEVFQELWIERFKPNAPLS